MSYVQRWTGFVAVAAIALSAFVSSGGRIHFSTASADVAYMCMTDDGYGRKRPCSAGYLAANPNWRGGDHCFTDDGYGRFRSCSAGMYKAKAPQQQQQQPEK